MKIPRSQITLTCLLVTAALAATAFAVDPPPDGGYPNGNTAEGQNALFTLTTGSNNTAIGFEARERRVLAASQSFAVSDSRIISTKSGLVCQTGTAATTAAIDTNNRKEINP